MELKTDKKQKDTTRLTFICLKSTKGTLEKGVKKYVQS